MLRKLLKIFRSLFIGLIWSYVCLVLFNAYMVLTWNFSLFYTPDWQRISLFWEKGGVIKSYKDYIFLGSFILMLPLWIYGWYKLCKIKYLNILLFPITAYNDYVIRKYGSDSKRIILKNLQSSAKLIEQIKGEIESIKPKEAAHGKELRDLVADKVKKLNQ